MSNIQKRIIFHVAKVVFIALCIGVAALPNPTLDNFHFMMIFVPGFVCGLFVNAAQIQMDK